MTILNKTLRIHFRVIVTAKSTMHNPKYLKHDKSKCTSASMETVELTGTASTMCYCNR